MTNVRSETDAEIMCIYIYKYIFASDCLQALYIYIYVCVCVCVCVCVFVCVCVTWLICDTGFKWPCTRFIGCCFQNLIKKAQGSLV